MNASLIVVMNSLQPLKRGNQNALTFGPHCFMGNVTHECPLAHLLSDICVRWGKPSVRFESLPEPTISLISLAVRSTIFHEESECNLIRKDLPEEDRSGEVASVQTERLHELSSPTGVP